MYEYFVIKCTLDDNKTYYKAKKIDPCDIGFGVSVLIATDKNYIFEAVEKNEKIKLRAVETPEEISEVNQQFDSNKELDIESKFESRDDAENISKNILDKLNAQNFSEKTKNKNNQSITPPPLLFTLPPSDLPPPLPVDQNKAAEKGVENKVKENIIKYNVNSYNFENGAYFVAVPVEKSGENKEKIIFELDENLFPPELESINDVGRKNEIDNNMVITNGNETFQVETDNPENLAHKIKYSDVFKENIYNFAAYNPAPINDLNYSPPKAGHLDVVISKNTKEKLENYLTEIKANPNKMGVRLRYILSKSTIDKLTIFELVDALLKTKKPTIFAERSVGSFGLKGNGSDWTKQEIQLLGRLGSKINVKVYANTTWKVDKEKNIYKDQNKKSNPLSATLLVTNGALLDGCSADHSEVITEAGNFHRENFKKYFEDRLIPLLLSINDDAFVTLPVLGAGFFAGPYGSEIRHHFPEILKESIEKYASQLTHIKGIALGIDEDKAPTTSEDLKVDNTKVIKFITFDSSRKSSLSLLSQPAAFGQEFEKCKLYSLVAGDHVSFPGNDGYGGSCFTAEGGVCTKTNVFQLITGSPGQFDAEKGQFFADSSNDSVWQNICQAKKTQLTLNSLTVFNKQDNNTNSEKIVSTEESKKFYKVKSLYLDALEPASYLRKDTNLLLKKGIPEEYIKILNLRERFIINRNNESLLENLNNYNYMLNSPPVFFIEAFNLLNKYNRLIDQPIFDELKNNESFCKFIIFMGRNNLKLQDNSNIDKELDLSQISLEIDNIQKFDLLVNLYFDQMKFSESSSETKMQPADYQALLSKVDGEAINQGKNLIILVPVDNEVSKKIHEINQSDSVKYLYFSQILKIITDEKTKNFIERLQKHNVDFRVAPITFSDNNKPSQLIHIERDLALLEQLKNNFSAKNIIKGYLSFTDLPVHFVKDKIVFDAQGQISATKADYIANKITALSTEQINPEKSENIIVPIALAQTLEKIMSDNQFLINKNGCNNPSLTKENTIESISQRWDTFLEICRDQDKASRAEHFQLALKAIESFDDLYCRSKNAITDFNSLINTQLKIEFINFIDTEIHRLEKPLESLIYDKSTLKIAAYKALKQYIQDNLEHPDQSLSDLLETVKDYHFYIDDDGKYKLVKEKLKDSNDRFFYYRNKSNSTADGYLATLENTLKWNRGSDLKEVTAYINFNAQKNKLAQIQQLLTLVSNQAEPKAATENEKSLSLTSRFLKYHAPKELIQIRDKATAKNNKNTPADVREKFEAGRKTLGFIKTGEINYLDKPTRNRAHYELSEKIIKKVEQEIHQNPHAYANKNIEFLRAFSEDEFSKLTAKLNIANLNLRTDFQVINKTAQAWATEKADVAKPNKLGIVNLANAWHIGGGPWKKNCSAQEENLLEKSDALYSLIKEYPNAQNEAGLDRLGYAWRLEGVRTFELDENRNAVEMVRYTMIATAAIDFRNKDIRDYVNTSEGREDYMRYMAHIIRLQCEHALAAGNEILGAGALGCGVFDNNPFLVAAIYRSVLSEDRYKNLQVEFPITDQKLCNKFWNVFKCNAENLQSILKNVPAYDPLSKAYNLSLANTQYYPTEGYLEKLEALDKLKDNDIKKIFKRHAGENEIVDFINDNEADFLKWDREILQSIDKICVSQNNTYKRGKYDPEFSPKNLFIDLLNNFFKKDANSSQETKKAILKQFYKISLVFPKVLNKNFIDKLLNLNLDILYDLFKKYTLEKIQAIKILLGHNKPISNLNDYLNNQYFCKALMLMDANNITINDSGVQFLKKLYSPKNTTDVVDDNIKNTSSLFNSVIDLHSAQNNFSYKLTQRDFENLLNALINDPNGKNKTFIILLAVDNETAKKIHEFNKNTSLNKTLSLLFASHTDKTMVDLIVFLEANSIDFKVAPITMCENKNQPAKLTHIERDLDLLKQLNLQNWGSYVTEGYINCEKLPAHFDTKITCWNGKNEVSKLQYVEDRILGKINLNQNSQDDIQLVNSFSDVLQDIISKSNNSININILINPAIGISEQWDALSQQCTKYNTPDLVESFSRFSLFNKIKQKTNEERKLTARAISNFDALYAASHNNINNFESLINAQTKMDFIFFIEKEISRLKNNNHGAFDKDASPKIIAYKALRNCIYDNLENNAESLNDLLTRVENHIVCIDKNNYKAVLVNDVPDQSLNTNQYDYIPRERKDKILNSQNQTNRTSETFKELIDWNRGSNLTKVTSQVNYAHMKNKLNIVQNSLLNKVQPQNGLQK